MKLFIVLFHINIVLKINSHLIGIDNFLISMHIFAISIATIVFVNIENKDLKISMVIQKYF